MSSILSASMHFPEVPVTIIRGGTSRGVFLSASDLPEDPGPRGERILRLFGSEGAILADGLGGENPVLRKAAIVCPAGSADDGTPRVRYTFGQVEADLRTLQHAAECGNVAAGVPAFSALQGWVPAPRASGRVWIDLVNTGRSVVAEWVGAPTATQGCVRLGFVSPAESRTSALFSQASAVHVTSVGGKPVRYSAVRAINDYLFVDARSLDIDRPAEVRELDASTYASLCDLMKDAQARLDASGSLKVCLVAPSAGRDNALSALIVYPLERRLHGSFAVTGAIALGVASCLEGTVPHEMARLAGQTSMDIVHRSGVLSIALERGVDEIPERVAIERTFRVLMRGTAL